MHNTRRCRGGCGKAIAEPGILAAVLLIVAAQFGGEPAWGQQVPTSVDPGQIERRFDTKPKLRDQPGPNSGLSMK